MPIAPIQPSLILAAEATHTNPHEPRVLARAFGLEQWLEVAVKGECGRLAAHAAAPALAPLAPLKDRFLPLPELYAELFRLLPGNSRLLRTRNFDFPLTDIFARETASAFPDADYVLSTADEILPCGFFMERLTREAVRAIAAMPTPLMPPGYFNGSALPGAGRLFSSREAARFCLEEHFETILPEPRQLTLDIMPQCNYACRKCHYHSPLLPTHDAPGAGIRKVRPQPAMPMELYTAVLRHARGFAHLRNLHLYMSGEPLMHPHLAEMVRFAQELGFAPSFASNASLLDEVMSLRLLEAGITYIGFSIDSLDPATYRTLQGGDLGLVEKNIMRWQELCLQRTGRFAGSIMCVLSDANLGEAEQFFRTWTARGFTVLFNYELDVHTRRMAGAPSGTMEDKGCTSPYYLYVDAQGRVLICSAQLNGSSLPAPSFLSLPAPEIWRAPYLRTARRDLLDGVRYDFCADCSGSCVMSNSTWQPGGNGVICKSRAGWYGAPPRDPHERRGRRRP